MIWHWYSVYVPSPCTSGARALGMSTENTTSPLATETAPRLLMMSRAPLCGCVGRRTAQASLHRFHLSSVCTLSHRLSSEHATCALAVLAEPATPAAARAHSAASPDEKGETRVGRLHVSNICPLKNLGTLSGLSRHVHVSRVHEACARSRPCMLRRGTESRRAHRALSSPRSPCGSFRRCCVASPAR